ncbi:MAG: SDR family oxidoreductase [Cyclobacteriaceae bacterium]|nr:SDR family oxidoreductase [Cyclobacteriaceae bacterium]
MKVLILGANSDVAESLAQLLAQKGHELTLAARSMEKLTALKSDLEIRANAVCSVVNFDAEKIEHHKQFYDSLNPKPDWVICAFGQLVEQDETSAELVNKSYLVNMLGAISILNIVANDFSNRKSGVIIGISSVAGDRGRASNYTYGSAKAGFTAYLAGLRNRLYKSGVHVITIKPGFIKTKMTEHLDLPKILTASPHEVAVKIEKAIRKKSNVVYVKWFWRYIMIIIKAIPEGLFKKLNL